MSEWKEYKLGELISILTDYHANGSYETLKANVELLNEDSYSVMIRTKNFEQNNFSKELKYIDEHAYNHLSKSKVYPNDIIMNKIANAGSIYRMPELNRPVSLAMNLFLIRFSDEKANQIFMYYYLKQNERYIKTFAEGSVTKTIRKDAVRNLDVKIPVLQEQIEILNILNNLDKKITLLRQQNQDLEELAQTLFKRWFVEFEFPVCLNHDSIDCLNHDSLDFHDNHDSKNQGNQVNPKNQGSDNFTTYKSSGGKMVESELGEIPEGWILSTIGKHVDTLGGGTPSTTEQLYWENGDILWYSPTDLTREKSVFSNGSAKKITRLGLQKSSAKLFPAYSLLMTSRATVGVITINTHEASTNQGFITLIPNEELSLYFLYDWLKTKLITVHSLASGSTFPEISKTDFRNIEVLLANKKVRLLFDETVQPIFKTIENNTNEIQTLTQLRDTLLPKLMSGELRVKI